MLPGSCGDGVVMHLNRFDMNLLIALDALLRERSVTRAGERIYLSQSAMSGALQRLRDHFGDELLVRVGRELELTPRAEALVEPIREILLRVQAALEAEPSFDPATAMRTFSIMMSDYCFVAYMRAVIKRLQAEAPGITCRVERLDAASIKRLEAGDVHFCLLPETPHLGGSVALITEAGKSVTLRRSRLFSDDWVCAVWRDHPTVGETMTVDEYLSLPHAVADFGPGTITVEDLAVRRDGLSLKASVSYGGFSFLPMLLEGTSLVATIQRRLGAFLQPGLPIRLLEPPIALTPIHETLVWHGRHEFEPGHMWLRKVMVETALTL
jgi:LysR family nod box-dependent transcriptional activator